MMAKKSTGSEHKMKTQFKKAKLENKYLRETCEVLADKRILADIQISLRQIREGKGIPLSKL